MLLIPPAVTQEIHVKKCIDIPVNLSICHQSKIAIALEMAQQTDLSYCQYYPITVFWRLSSPAQAQPAAGMCWRLLEHWDITALWGMQHTAHGMFG